MTTRQPSQWYPEHKNHTSRHNIHTSCHLTQAKLKKHHNHPGVKIANPRQTRGSGRFPSPRGRDHVFPFAGVPTMKDKEIGAAGCRKHLILDRQAKSSPPSTPNNQPVHVSRLPDVSYPDQYVNIRGYCAGAGNTCEIDVEMVLIQLAHPGLK